MITTQLEYHRPADGPEASQLILNLGGRVAVLGGGTQLVPRMTRDEQSVDHLIDIGSLGLDTITVNQENLTLGSRVTYDDVLTSEEALEALPLLLRVSSGVTGGRQIRNQGTIGGSACFAMPGSDMPGVLVGLGATFVAHGPDGLREISAGDFFLDAFVTGLGPGEFLHSVRLPRCATSGYCKVKHSAGSWPIVTATAVTDAAGTRVVLGAVQAVPMVVDLTAVDLDDRSQIISAVSSAVTNPWSDPLAPGEYRARIAGPAAVRAVNEMNRVRT